MAPAPVVAQNIACQLEKVNDSSSPNTITCQDESAIGDNLIYLENLFWCPSNNLLLYCPTCLSIYIAGGKPTTNDLNWNDSKTEILPEFQTGEPDLQRASCKQGTPEFRPDSPGTLQDNALMPPRLRCSNPLAGVYFDEACVDYTAYVVPVGVIIGASLGALAGVLLIGGIIAVIVVKKRTKRIEQEKTEGMAKVIMLDAEVPAPLYQAEDCEEELDMPSDMDSADENDLVMRVTTARSLASGKSQRAVGNTYAMPEFNLYGVYGVQTSDLEEGGGYDLNAHLNLGEGRGFYGGDDKNRAYAHPEETNYGNPAMWGGGGGGGADSSNNLKAPAKRMGSESAVAGARSNISKRMMQMESQRGGAGSKQSSRSGSFVSACEDDAGLDDANPYTFDWSAPPSTASVQPSVWGEQRPVPPKPPIAPKMSSKIKASPFVQRDSGGEITPQAQWSSHRDPYGSGPSDAESYQSKTLEPQKPKKKSKSRSVFGGSGKSSRSNSKRSTAASSHEATPNGNNNMYDAAWYDTQPKRKSGKSISPLPSTTASPNSSNEKLDFKKERRSRRHNDGGNSGRNGDHNNRRGSNNRRASDSSPSGSAVGTPTKDWRYGGVGPSPGRRTKTREDRMPAYGEFH
eukprot:gene680-417_t